MQFSLSILALAASLLSVSASGTHQRFHDMKKRSTFQVNSLIQTLTAASGGAVAQGSGNQFVNTLVNNSTQDATVLFWESENFAMAVNAYNPDPAPPALIVELPAGQSRVVSFTSAFSGAYAAVFGDTALGMGGNIKAPWVEITTSGQATGDVSFLPDMSSQYLSLDTGKCVSDWTTCAFKCNDGSDFCMAAGVAELMPCNSEFANFYAGPNGAGPWSGGCQLTNAFTTTWTEPN